MIQCSPDACLAQARPRPTSHHLLEKLLGWPAVRSMLGALTRADARGVTALERLCSSYHDPLLSRAERLKWRMPELAIDMVLKWAKLDRDLMTEELFHDQATVRSLALAGRSIAQHGLSAPQRFTAPLMVVWNITRACNLACRHCYGNPTPHPAADELTVREKLDVVDKMAAAGVPLLAISGGEPLLSKDLWPVLYKAREQRIQTTLATNGTLLSRQNAERLITAGVGYVEVSIDSIVPEEHDRFRGRPGAWNRAIDGIRNSVACGMRTGLATCLTRKTVDSVDEIVQFAISLGCRNFSHINFIPAGRGAEMVDEDLTPAQREWLMERLAAHLQEGRIKVTSTAPQFGRACLAYAPPDGIFSTGHACSGQGTQAAVLARYMGGCGAGRCYCALQANGDVTPCVNIPGLKVGNLRDDSLENIWNCTLFDILSNRNDRGNHCVACRERAYCGGCRARALAYLGDIRAGDPGCPNNLYLWDRLAPKPALDVLSKRAS